MKYKGIELKENTTLQIFDPPKEMLVWDQDDSEPLKREVCAIFKHKKLNLAITTDITYFCHCADIPEEAKPGRATSRELAKWLAQGNGEWCMKNGTGQIGANTNYGYSKYEENQNVTDGILVRKWEDTEWHEPTVDYMGIE